MKKVIYCILALLCVSCNHDKQLGEQTLTGIYYEAEEPPWVKTPWASYLRTEDGREYCLTGYEGQLILYNYHKDTLYSNTFKYDFHPYNVPVFNGDTIIITGYVSIHMYEDKEYYLLGGQTYVDIISRGKTYYDVINRELEYQRTHPEEYENKASLL